MLRQQVDVSIVKSYPRASCAYRAVCTEMGWNPVEMQEWAGDEMAMRGFRWPNILCEAPQQMIGMDSG